MPAYLSTVPWVNTNECLLRRFASHGNQSTAHVTNSLMYLWRNVWCELWRAIARQPAPPSPPGVKSSLYFSSTPSPHRCQSQTPTCLYVSHLYSLSRSSQVPRQGWSPADENRISTLRKNNWRHFRWCWADLRCWVSALRLLADLWDHEPAYHTWSTCSHLTSLFHTSQEGFVDGGDVIIQAMNDLTGDCAPTNTILLRSAESSQKCMRHQHTVRCLLPGSNLAITPLHLQMTRNCDQQVANATGNVFGDQNF